MFFDNLEYNIFNKDKLNLFTTKDGFNLGNMFKDEYDGYKNYKVGKLDANGEKEKILLCIYEYDFALVDLGLYLDLHPEDMDAYNMFKKINDERKYYIDMYENKYGPLELDFTDYNSYEWFKSPWPFEGVDINV